MPDLDWAIPAFPEPRTLDTIDLRGVRVHGKHGVLPEEKVAGHDFLVDVFAWLDTRAAARTDDLTLSVSYADVAQIIEHEVSAPSVDLIETLSHRIGHAVLAHSPLIRRVRVGVNKPSAPIAQPFTNVTVSAECEAEPVVSVIALGANMGDAAGTLERALEALEAIPGTRVLGSSHVIETDPVSDVDQDPYLNAVVAVETALSPWQLHEYTSLIENAAHRTREVRWGPRTLDLDIVTYAGLTSRDPLLTLPHPRAHERAFVLQPLADVAALLGRPLRLPGHDPVERLLARAADREGVRPGPALAGFGQAR